MNREQFPRCSHCNDGRMSVSGDGSNWCDRCEVPQQARAEMVRHKLPDGSVLSVDSRVLVDAMLRLGKAVIAGGPPDDIGRFLLGVRETDFVNIGNRLATSSYR